MNQASGTLKQEYDVIIAGAGSGESAATGVLAANSDLEILLLEAGDDNNDPRFNDPDRWPENLGSERDWSWVTEPNPALDGHRTLSGEMAEIGDGAAQLDETIRDGHRQSVYRSFVVPQLERPNLTVATDTDTDTDTEVSRVAGVGANLDDHAQFGLVWEASDEPLPAAAVGRAVTFWGQPTPEEGPPFVMYQGAGAFVSPEIEAAIPKPERAITFLLGMRLSSRGSVRLSGSGLTDQLLIENAYFTDPGDVARAVEAFSLVREIAESEAMRPFIRRQVAPVASDPASVEAYIRQAALTYWHQSGTAKMGTDAMSVVNGQLAVHGIAGLRIADASVLPRVTTGNTMAPSVVIGEHAAQAILGEISAAADTSGRLAEPVR